MKETIGITAIIQGELGEEIRKLWDMADPNYSVKGVKSFDYPNLGFQGGICEDASSLEKELSDLCLSVRPFEISVEGFGFFEKPHKVVFLKVVKTEELKRIHTWIHDALERNCISTFRNYSPQNWTPHITIAMNDLSDESFRKVQQNLGGNHPSYKQRISRIQMVTYTGSGQIVLTQDWECKGSERTELPYAQGMRS